MLAHDFGDGVAMVWLLRLLFWAEISLKDRKILLILPEIGSLGGVLQQISLYNELVRKHACVSNSAG